MSLQVMASTIDETLNTAESWRRVSRRTVIGRSGRPGGDPAKLTRLSVVGVFAASLAPDRQQRKPRPT